jgi:predicted CopG family antitoxin
MAVKTITIDIEAYETLARRKRPGQSFSQVIKEHLGQSRTGRDLAATLRGGGPSARTLDEVDDLILSRRRSPARVGRL